MKEWVTSGEQLLADNPVFPSTDIEMRVVGSMCCALTYSCPDHPLLPVLSARARQLLVSSPDSLRKLNFGLMLFNDYVWREGAAKARLLLDELAKVGADADVEIAWRTCRYAMQTLFDFMTGNQESALRAAREGLALCDASGVNAFKVFLLSHGSWAALSCGNRSLGRKYVESIVALAPTGHGHATYFWMLAWLDWSTGQTAAGLEKMKIALESMRSTGHVFGVAMMHLYLSVLQLELGELRKSRTNLDEALLIAESGSSGWIKFNFYFIDARYKLKQGQETAYLDALRQGFETGRELEVYTTLWWDPVRMSQLCAVALEHGIEVDYVQEMIRRNQLVPDTCAAALEHWPWSIRIYVLGEFRLVIDGKSVGSASRGQKKITELLKALVVLGGRDVSVTRLTDALWPDSEGDDASNSLKTAVHRLRKLLGQADAVEVSAGHLSLNAQYCWTDLGQFERLVDEARNDAENPTPLEHAINLYRGPLLNAEEAVFWMIAPGERVRSKFLTAVTMAGQNWESKRQWSKATGVYERALEVDHLIESFYLQLMHCHLNLGRRAEAISVFDRCTRILAAELGVEPSRKLQTFGHALMKPEQAG